MSAFCQANSFRVSDGSNKRNPRKSNKKSRSALLAFDFFT